MNCYKCGAVLGKEDKCLSCAADVREYKKIVALSNRCYNQGLELAKIRDLSGAAEYLKNSLKYDKNNTNARNLLGLVNFELGETVEALAQWMISIDLKKENNRAKEYLVALNADKNKLDSLNQSIKKYNQALLCCQQGNWDIAGIHMKKVLSMNPRMVRGYQLMALISMKEGKPEDAKKALKSASRIDVGNPLSFRYSQELSQKMGVLEEEASPKKGASTPKKKDELLSYRSGNDTIIRPAQFKDQSNRTTVLHIAIGLIIGIALTAFLVVPGLRQNVQGGSNATVNDLATTIDMKDQTIATLERQLEEERAKITTMEEDNQSGQVRATSYESLIRAYNAANSNDLEAAGLALESVNADSLNEDMRSMYDAVYGQVNAEHIAELSRTGREAFNRRDYETAIENLSQVVAVDEMYDSGFAVSNLARSYAETGELEQAATYFRRVVELLPGTQRATTARNFLRNNGFDQ